MRAALRVGVAVTEEAEVVRLLVEALAKALAIALSRAVDGLAVEGYERLRQGLGDGSLDIAWLPPFVADRALRADLVVPLALPVRGGSSSYSSALFARPDSAHRSIEDLDGVRVAWVHQRSVAGCLLPRAMLAAAGHDLARLFRSESFVESHHEVVRAVLAGEADVGATFAHLDDPHGERRIRHAAWGDERVQVLATYGPIPVDMLVVAAGMPRAQLDALRHELIECTSSLSARAARALLDADAFVSPSWQHLEALRTYARAMSGEVDELTNRYPSGIFDKGEVTR